MDLKILQKGKRFVHRTSNLQKNVTMVAPERDILYLLLLQGYNPTILPKKENGKEKK